MIVIHELTKQLHPRTGIQQISFQLSDGEIVPILGSTNSGRTSLLEILSGQLLPDSGSIWINQQDFLKHSKNLKKQIGYMPQKTPIYSHLRLQEQLNFLWDLKKIKGQKQKHIDELCKQIEFTISLNTFTKDLSPSELKLFAFLQALLGNPPILLLDRPTYGLNIQETKHMWKLIKNLQGDHTVLIATNSPIEAQNLGERMLILDQGKLLADIPVSDVATHSSGSYALRVDIEGNYQEIIPVFFSFSDIRWTQLDAPKENTHRFLITSETNQNLRQSILSAFEQAGFPITFVSSVSYDLPWLLQTLHAQDTKKEILEGVGE